MPRFQKPDSMEHFKFFAQNVRVKLDKYKDLSEDELTEIQRQQVEGLAEIERQLRDFLLGQDFGKQCYVAFIEHVKGNILRARPYFRAQAGTFSKNISPALKQNNIDALMHQDINYHFVNFMISSGVKIPLDSEFWKYVKQIEDIREELITMNTPLAISRATLFWRKTQKSHLSFMDLVQMAVEGLIAAIDKYSGTYKKVWRSVAIGRMTGNHLEQYNQTMVHFWPKDRRRLYRAHKTISKYDDVDIVDVVEAVNFEAPEKQQVGKDELQQLIAAASVSSYDSLNKTRFYEVIEQIEDENRPDAAIEKNDLIVKLGKAIINLSNFEKKILKLKGIEL